MEMKTAVVTGAGGFIGKSLVRKLIETQYYVYAIDKNVNFLKEFENCKNIKIIEENLETIERISTKVEKNIDVFFHFAWQGISATDYKDVNVQKDNILLSIKVMQTAMDLECKKFIFFSTNQQFLLNKNSIDNEYSTSSIYGTCKYAVNMICQTLAMNKMKYNTILFTNVFGVGDYSNRTANQFIKKLMNNENLDLIEGNNLYDWVYIDDAVNGILAVVNDGINNKNYYIGNRNLRTFKDIITEVRDTINKNSQLNFGKYMDTSFTDYKKIDLDALYNDTGFECKSDFKESVLKTAEWLKSIESK